MSENSKIAWCDNTFNPWIGCQKVSEGCKNCYAETLMTRKPKWANTWGPPVLTQRLKTSDAYWKKPLQWNKKAERLGIRYKVFCGSLCDWAEIAPSLDNIRAELFTCLIDKTPNIDWLLLTKRIENARLYTFPDNVWVGTSVENQKTADERIPILKEINAKVKFLSIEPMLEPINFESCGYYCDEKVGHVDHKIRGIDWVIVGGESGPNHRPFEWDWARDIRDQCRQAGVAFFMKQGAGPSQAHMPEIPEDLRVREYPV